MAQAATWANALASLKESLADEADDTLAQEWKDAILANSEPSGQVHRYIQGLEPKEAALHLLHCLGRGHALIEQSKKWTHPVIGKARGSSELHKTRGVLWKYVMTYCGWEQCTKCLGITQKLQNRFLEPNGKLQAPSLNKRKGVQVSDWTGDMEEAEGIGTIEGIDIRWMEDFLALERDYKMFPEWLKGEQVELSDSAILAVLRNIVAHGSLSPSKAVRWHLDQLYGSATRLIIRSFPTLIGVLTPER